VSGFHVVHRTQSDKPSTLKINRVFVSELVVFEHCKSNSLFALRVLFDIFNRRKVIDNGYSSKSDFTFSAFYLPLPMFGMKKLNLYRVMIE